MTICDYIQVYRFYNPLISSATQRLVLAAAAGWARHLRLKITSLARGAYPQAAKPLSAANGVRRFRVAPDSLPLNQNHDCLDHILQQTH